MLSLFFLFVIQILDYMFDQTIHLLELVVMNKTYNHVQFLRKNMTITNNVPFFLS